MRRVRHFRHLLAAVVCSFGTITACAAETKAHREQHVAGATNSPATASPQLSISTNPPLKQIGDGLFELGSVRLDQRRKTVSFPASVNMNAGVVEYFLVQARGKVHESVLRTDVEPAEIHMAKLLISAKHTEASAHPNTNGLSGEQVTVSVSWLSGEIARSNAAEEMILSIQSPLPPSRGAWVYNGSRLVNGSFTAQRDGSIMSIIADPEALINNPRPGRENDDIWRVNTNTVPPLNTPVQVTLQFGSSDEKVKP